MLQMQPKSFIDLQNAVNNTRAIVQKNIDTILTSIKTPAPLAGATADQIAAAKQQFDTAKENVLINLAAVNSLDSNDVNFKKKVSDLEDSLKILNDASNKQVEQNNELNKNRDALVKIAEILTHYDAWISLKNIEAVTGTRSPILYSGDSLNMNGLKEAVDRINNPDYITGLAKSLMGTHGITLKKENDITSFVLHEPKWPWQKRPQEAVEALIGTVVHGLGHDTFTVEGATKREKAIILNAIIPGKRDPNDPSKPPKLINATFIGDEDLNSILRARVGLSPTSNDPLVLKQWYDALKKNPKQQRRLWSMLNDAMRKELKDHLSPKELAAIASNKEDLTSNEDTCQMIKQLEIDRSKEYSNNLQAFYSQNPDRMPEIGEIKTPNADANQQLLAKIFKAKKLTKSRPISSNAYEEGLNNFIKQLPTDKLKHLELSAGQWSFLESDTKNFLANNFEDCSNNVISRLLLDKKVAFDQLPKTYWQAAANDPSSIHEGLIYNLIDEHLKHPSTSFANGDLDRFINGLSVEQLANLSKMSDKPIKQVHAKDTFHPAEWIRSQFNKVTHKPKAEDQGTELLDIEAEPEVEEIAGGLEKPIVQLQNDIAKATILNTLKEQAKIKAFCANLNEDQAVRLFCTTNIQNETALEMLAKKISSPKISRLVHSDPQNKTLFENQLNKLSDVKANQIRNAINSVPTSETEYKNYINSENKSAVLQTKNAEQRENLFAAILKAKGSKQGWTNTTDSNQEFSDQLEPFFQQVDVREAEQLYQKIPTKPGYEIALQKNAELILDKHAANINAWSSKSAAKLCDNLDDQRKVRLLNAYGDDYSKIASIVLKQPTPDAQQHLLDLLSHQNKLDNVLQAVKTKAVEAIGEDEPTEAAKNNIRTGLKPFLYYLETHDPAKISNTYRDPGIHPTLKEIIEELCPNVNSRPRPGNAPSLQPRMLP